jgi:organic radical activating enzyme
MKQLLTRIMFSLKKAEGIEVTIHASMKCNLTCEYCTSDLTVMDERPVFKKELTAIEWLRIIDDYNQRSSYRDIKPITVVVFGGGEPAMYKDIVPLVNGLIERKIAIRILTNLLLRNMLGIKKSNYVRMVATYHPSGDLKKYLTNLKLYRKKFLVRKKEITGVSNVFKNSEKVRKQTKPDDPERTTKGILYLPNGVKTDTCYSEGLLADNYISELKKEK